MLILWSTNKNKISSFSKQLNTYWSAGVFIFLAAVLMKTQSKLTKVIKFSSEQKQFTPKQTILCLQRFKKPKMLQLFYLTGDEKAALMHIYNNAKVKTVYFMTAKIKNENSF